MHYVTLIVLRFLGMVSIFYSFHLFFLFIHLFFAFEWYLESLWYGMRDDKCTNNVLFIIIHVDFVFGLLLQIFKS